MRDWKLESLANGKEISAVPFKNGKRGVPLKVPHNFRTEFRENYLTISLQTEISGFSRQMVSTPYVRGQISVKIFAPNGGYCLYVQRALVEIIAK